MIKALKKLLKSKIFIISAIFVTSIVVTYLLSNRPIKPAPPIKSISLNQTGWKSILPGLTQYSELTQLTDKPLIALPQPNGSTVVSYQSSSQYWTNDVVVKNNTVDFIHERLFPPDNTSFIDKAKNLKSAPALLYGEESQSEIYLFVYASEGIALLTNKDKDVLFEAWYFPPTNITEVLKRPEFQSYSTTEQLRDH